MFLLVVRHKSWAFYMFTYNNISVGQLLLNTGQSRGGLSFRKSYTGLYKTQDFCRQFSISYMFIYLQIRLEVQHWRYMFTQNDIYKSIHNPLSARPAISCSAGSSEYFETLRCRYPLLMSTRQGILFCCSCSPSLSCVSSTWARRGHRTGQVGQGLCMSLFFSSLCTPHKKWKCRNICHKFQSEACSCR